MCAVVYILPGLLVVTVYITHSPYQIWELPYDGDMFKNRQVKNYYGIDVSKCVCNARKC